jgi:hypothetical protein
MNRRSVLILLTATAGAPLALPAQKGKRGKGKGKAEIAVLKISTIHQNGIIEYEGDLKNVSERPLTGLTMRVEFLDVDGVMASAQKIEIEEGVVQPGEERHFSIQGHDVPRAVSFRVSFTSKGDHDLYTSGAGPYPLD